ncbi:MAG TPA: hypothetical protein VNA12_10175 [Mycobacteriales bacterium]|nr:hypothetical protein [Mycobacteriales bacterium]
MSRRLHLRLGIAALLLATGCAGGASPAAPSAAPQSGPGLDRLDEAIDLVNTGRAASLAHVAAAITGLERRDDLDDLAAAGDRPAATAADPAADATYAKVGVALRDLGGSLESFQRGLGDLAAAAQSPELDTAQRRLIGTAIAHGRAEITATRTLATAVRSGIAAYDTLGARIDEWLRRARAGWYRNREESASAYVVLVGDLRERLEAVRGDVARADSARTTAVSATTRSFALARRALAPLTGRPTEVDVPPSELAG